MVDCGATKCLQERKNIKKELLSWTKKIPLLIGKYLLFINIIFWLSFRSGFLSNLVKFGSGVPAKFTVKMAVPMCDKLSLCVIMSCVRNILLLEDVMYFSYLNYKVYATVVFICKCPNKDNFNYIIFYCMSAAHFGPIK